MRKPRIVGDRILVKTKKDNVDKHYRYTNGFYEEISPSGMVIARLTQEQVDNLRLGTQEAYVMQIGNTAYTMLGNGEPWVKVGDLVTVVRWSGEALPDIGDGEIYRVISDSDVYCVWEGEDLND